MQEERPERAANNLGNRLPKRWEESRTKYTCSDDVTVAVLHKGFARNALEDENGRPDQGQPEENR